MVNRAGLLVFRFKATLPLVVAFVFSLASPASGIACDRESFGGYKQQNKKNVRAIVLERESLVPVTYRNSKLGRSFIVESGLWVDIYTNKRYKSADDIQIDHLVPVCWAWEHGASDWDDDKKKVFYNDADFLFPVGKSLNNQKSDMGLDEFLPLKVSFSCKYAVLFLEAIAKYDLMLEDQERGTFQATRELACSGLSQKMRSPSDN